MSWHSDRACPDTVGFLGTMIEGEKLMKVLVVFAWVQVISMSLRAPATRHRAKRQEASLLGLSPPTGLNTELQY